jgi:MerR family redox-sensitive transcriptional activator SoxR
MPQPDAKPSRTLTIGEVAARTGLAASALRFYEREGLIPKADRRGGRRVWNGDILDRLALIEVAKAAGFRVAEIRALLAGFARRAPPGQRWRKLAERKLTELEARSAEIERMKRVLEAVTRCDCPTLEDCSRAIRGRAPRRKGPLT